MGYSLNTKRVYRSQAKRLSKAYELMPDTDVRKPRVLEMVLKLKEKIGLDWTEQEFNDFWNAKPGRPLEIGGNAEDIIKEMTHSAANADLSPAERLKLFKANERKKAGLPEEMSESESAAQLEEMMKMYPVNPEQENNRGHEDKAATEGAIVTYWAEWVD